MQLSPFPITSQQHMPTFRETPRAKDFGPSASPTGNQLIARMRTQADLSQEAAMPRGPERKAAVYQDLVRTAQETQVGALAKLEELKAAGLVTSVESMYLPNAIVVTTAAGKHQAVADALAGVADVAAVGENRKWSVDGVERAAQGAGTLAAPEMVRPIAERRGVAPDTAPEGGIEWGVAKIGAPAAWAKGFDGTGVTIGIVDTGLDASHPAIAAHYRGTNADGTRTDDHNWFDGIAGKTAPYDDGDHGTHVAGSAAGGNASDKIGVAPGAKLIAAKAIGGDGYNTTAATLRALQWMLAPTRTDGTGADPTKGADVVNNSWGNADRADATFLETFAGLKAAGIEVVTSAGNDGPGAGTVSPPGSYPGYFSVAATSSSDAVARFSSRGPSKFAAPGELVPNIAAPGAGVRSSVPGGGYTSFSGTSMASPHAAGAVAILLQAKPQATHDELKQALETTAVDIDRPGPDTAAGYGRIDVSEALDALTGAGSVQPAAAIAA